MQIIFDDKPDAEVRAGLKQNSSRWAPSQGAWQRMLNKNGIFADAAEEYQDLSDEEYRNMLEAMRDEITAFILEQCRTKRSTHPCR